MSRTEKQQQQFYSTAAAIPTSVVEVVGLIKVSSVDGDDSADVLRSVVGTPTRRHRGQAFRPDLNHYTVRIS